jgi:hypothetical protein
VKVDPATQARLLELAELDGELDRVRHRRENLPEQQVLDERAAALRSAQDALVQAQMLASDLDREVKRREREIETVRARADRDRKLMESGSVSAKQLTDLEHEIGTLQKRQQTLEDDLLELMEQREAVGINERKSGEAVAAAEQEVAEARAAVESAQAELARTEEKCEAERAKLREELPAQLVERYDRVRQARGRGAGLLRARRCGACQLELDRVALSKVKAAADDEVVTCDNCGAILVRTAESGL